MSPEGRPPGRGRRGAGCVAGWGLPARGGQGRPPPSPLRPALLRKQLFPLGLLPALPSAAAAGPRPSAGSGRGAGGRGSPGGVPSLWRGGAARGANPRSSFLPRGEHGAKGLTPFASYEPWGFPVCRLGKLALPAPISRPSQGRGRRRGPSHNKGNGFSFLQPVPVLAFPGKVVKCRSFGCRRAAPPAGGLAILFIILTAGLVKNNSFQVLETVSDKIQRVT